MLLTVVETFLALSFSLTNVQNRSVQSTKNIDTFILQSAPCNSINNESNDFDDYDITIDAEENDKGDDRGSILPPDYEDESSSFQDAEQIYNFYYGFAGYFTNSSDIDYYYYTCPLYGDKIFQVSTLSSHCNINVDVYLSSDLVNPITSWYDVRNCDQYSFLSGGYTYYFKVSCVTMTSSHFYSITFTDISSNQSLLINNLLFHGNISSSHFYYTVEYVAYDYPAQDTTSSYFPNASSTTYYDYLSIGPYSFNISNDDRQVITNTVSAPYDAISRIEASNENESFCGSGSYISNKIIYSCAHLFVHNVSDENNIYRISTHYYVNDATSTPGRNDYSVNPYPMGKYKIEHYYYPIAFLFHIDGGDWALAVTSETPINGYPAYNSHGYFGMKIISNVQYILATNLFISGYPVLIAETGPCYQWTNIIVGFPKYVTDRNADETYRLHYHCITSSGDSGAPLYQQIGNSYYVVGNHNASNEFSDGVSTRIMVTSFCKALSLMGV